MKHDVKKIYRIIEWRKNLRPIKWIAREEGLTPREVWTVLKVAGEHVKGAEISAEDYDQLSYWVNQGASLNLISQETGRSRTTVKKWFPHAGLRLGKTEPAEIKQMFQDLERIDNHGNMSTRRNRE